MTTKILRGMCVTVMCSATMISGCKISQQGAGEDKRVRIEAPGASVKVDTGTSANDAGMPLYPGALAKQSSGDDKDRAHVSVNTPFLKVKVVALKFTSDDAPEKILGFYRDKLSNYGKVLECKDKGEDVALQHGHTLDSPVTCGTAKSGDGTTLKVGTEGNQHLVTVRSSGKGSEFELVYVRVGAGKDDDDYSGRQPS